MFSTAKVIKTKHFTAPSHKDPTISNSRKKIAVDLSQSMICNRSFDTAQTLLNKTTKNFQQTKICLRNKFNSENTSENFSSLSSASKTNSAPTEFFLMPVSHENPRNSKRLLQDLSNESNPKDRKKNENGRKKLVVIGKVDFCLKMHKLYPNSDIIWDIYGKIVKILAGKVQREHILLLRTASNEGPVIQSIYYNFKDDLANFHTGICVRAVGQFMNENRLRTFKLEKTDCEKYERDFARIQNVITFALPQNSIQPK